MSEEWATGLTVDRRKLEIVRRTLRVKEKRRLTPRMMRVVLAGEELDGFESPSPDDHVKVFFPAGDGTIAMRDYTPRHYDAAQRTLTIDFVLHSGGVGSAWAEGAGVGDELQIGGPRGSTVISAPGAWWMLIGDATALPSMGRRLEEMAEGTRVTCVVEVAGEEEKQGFETKANVALHWVHCAGVPDGGAVVERLEEMEMPEGPGYIWIAAEAEVAKAVRAYFVAKLGHPAEWVKASAYWALRADGG